MRQLLIAAAVAAALLCASWPASAERRVSNARPTVCVVPLGGYDKGMLSVVTRGIEYLYRLDVKLLEPRALPRSAWYSPRRRYRAEKLLNYLDAEVLPGSGCDLVMGFTGADISTTKGEHPDWGILGLAWIGGPSGVVSTNRLGRRVGARSKAKRAVKVMNHELGHARGLAARHRGAARLPAAVPCRLRLGRGARLIHRGRDFVPPRAPLRGKLVDP